MKAVPLRRIATVTLGKMIQSARRDEADVEAPYLRAAHVQPHGVLIEVADKTMWFSRAELDSLRLRSGDVVVVEGGAGYGRPAVIDTRFENWGFQNSINRIRPLPEYSHGRYLYYALEHVQQSGVNELAASVSTIPHLTAEKLSAIEIPVHGLNEQRRIADFLDRETAQIDDTIAAMRVLIERLEDRRRTEITLGVRGRAPESDRETVRVGRIAEVTLGKMLTPEPKGPAQIESRYLRAANVQPFGHLIEVDDKTMWFTPSEVQSLALQPGDAVVVEGGVGGYGRSAVVDERFAGWPIQNSIIRVCGRTEVADSRFLSYYFQDLLDSGETALAAAAATMPHFTAEKVRASLVALPTFEEQVLIVRHLDEVTAAMDQMINAADDAITLMEERRAAVISAAVTGRLDPKTGLEREESAA